ncbi:MAG: hypothetical protein AMXMBFR45_22900 [Gammaproteobacteria bacterium]|nr:MAG: hypothetical protein BroJett010_04510 [Gammaproteobacteria bacterium]
MWPGTGNMEMKAPMASAPVMLRRLTAKYMGWRSSRRNGRKYQACSFWRYCREMRRRNFRGIAYTAG